MTFKQQMEKAIKEYLTSMGFKYAPKQYLFYKDNENDLSFCTMMVQQVIIEKSIMNFKQCFI